MRTRMLRRPIVFLRVRCSISVRCSILILLIKAVCCSIPHCIFRLYRLLTAYSNIEAVRNRLLRFWYIAQSHLQLQFQNTYHMKDYLKSSVYSSSSLYAQRVATATSYRFSASCHTLRRIFVISFCTGLSDPRTKHGSTGLTRKICPSFYRNCHRSTTTDYHESQHAEPLFRPGRHFTLSQAS